MIPEHEVDVVGLRGDVPHHDFGCRHVAVLGERVVLAEPGVLPVVLVGEDHVLRLAHELLVLELADVRGRAGDVAVEEDAELHCTLLVVVVVEEVRPVLMVPIRTQAVNAWEADAMVEIASPWEDRRIIDDPYPFYEKLRESAPVWRVPGSRTFYVAPWALVAEAVARPDDFSSNLNAVLIADADGLPAEFDMTPLGSAINVLATGDEPDHGPARKLVAPHFTAGHLAALESGLDSVMDRLWSDCVGASGGERRQHRVDVARRRPSADDARRARDRAARRRRRADHRAELRERRAPERAAVGGSRWARSPTPPAR